MIAVVFEVWPAEEGRDAYLSLAAELRAALSQLEGFVSVERFASLSEPGKLLSLSFFRDEAAVQAFRNQVGHRAAQDAGRSALFRDYRLRVASVLRDYGRSERAEAPEDSRARHG